MSAADHATPTRTPVRGWAIESHIGNSTPRMGLARLEKVGGRLSVHPRLVEKCAQMHGHAILAVVANK